MKKISLLILYFLFLNLTISFAQKINKDFIDGEVYIKIKKEIPFKFDTLHATIEISSRLPFLLPLVDKYKITKAEASFYFSKSDKLQRTFRIHFKETRLVDLLVREMKNLNQIEYAEKIPLMHTDYTPNDLQTNNYSGQYALYNVHAQQAWDVSRGDYTTKVAVVDNAIDIDHEDLSFNVFNSWDISDADNNPRPPNPSDKRWWHGTHTSGIACAASGNNIGVASIGFNNSLIAIKATYNNTGNPKSIDHGYEGIAWATSHGADVISCSWGSYGFTLTGQNTIDDAYNANAIVVASVGNDNQNAIVFPAQYNHVIAVASVDINDVKATAAGGGSNYGTGVDVSAPGVSVFNTVPANQYDYMSGTSMAAPLVAGLCGLIKSANPGLSYDAVVNDIVSTADNIDGKNPGFEGWLGSGRINAFKAVEKALPCNPSIDLGSGAYSVPKTESSGAIFSANKIADVQVLFDAKTSVVLSPGFFVANGRTFRAYIDGCGGNLRLPNYTKSKKSNNAGGNEQIETPVITMPTNSLQVYPNPASRKIDVRYQLNKEDKIAFAMYNAEGDLVYQGKAEKKSAGSFHTEIDVGGFASGIYLLKCQGVSEVKTTTIVIAH